MARTAFTPRIFRTERAFWTVVLLLIVTFSVCLAAGWALLSLYRDTREDELGRRIASLGRAASPAIALEIRNPLEALADSDEPDNDDAWRAEIAALRSVYDDKFEPLDRLLEALVADRDAGVESAVLIGPNRRVLAAAGANAAPGETAPYLAIDGHAWEAARLTGSSEATPAYEYEGSLFKRVYVPIPTSEAPDAAAPDAEEAPTTPPTSVRTVAVLQLAASSSAFEDLAHLRAQGLILAGLVALLLALVGLIALQLVHRLVTMGEQAAHRDRLQALGTLAAGIAHEIRNPLGIIRALAEGVRDDLPENDEAGREMMTDILDEVQRLGRLVAQYLAFARPGERAPSDASAPPDAVIRDLALLLEKSSRQTSPVHLELADALPNLAIAEPALRQVLLNLMLNAREAAGNNGNVEVRASASRGGQSVEIAVTDDGHGIAPRDLRRVFDPFYTTKARGSGLGLAMCQRLVTESGGTIGIESEEGKGTTVRVVLPAAHSASG